MINRFNDQYHFLSNFYIHKIEYEGIKYPSNEHAYQASKSLSEDIRIEISKLSTPGQAKRIGNSIKLRDNWDQIKYDIMKEIIDIKFQDFDLMLKLQNTGDEELVEGNYWGDIIWGVCNGIGSNWLGKILMEIREQNNFLSTIYNSID
jgi:N-glycosidase YbiA